MALPSFTGVGRLTEDPQLRFSSAGIAFASISLAFNARRFDKDRQEWVDGDVCFIRGTAYRGLA
ncbi:single-stranded DNA-binding protein, partial [Salmonella enterica]|uniref:single-stranded DNA-binding protein n=1 Tax=Salmonella enterica TaxID=28901 RepID=UPI003299AD83